MIKTHPTRFVLFALDSLIFGNSEIINEFAAWISTIGEGRKLAGGTKSRSGAKKGEEKSWRVAINWPK